MAGDPREIRARIHAHVRENHPDRGGDPDTFAAGLARLRAELADATGTASRVTVTPALGPLAKAARVLRRGRRPPRVR